MPFTAGDLCCPQDMCVALDTTPAASSASWEVIPHVTQIQWNETANTAKIVTSSTGGNETSICGPVSNSGVLNMACHSGDGPAPFAINGKYNLIWAISCDEVEAEIATPNSGEGVYSAKIRITAINNDFNPAAGGAVLTPYSFEVVEWLVKPATQPVELD